MKGTLVIGFLVPSAVPPVLHPIIIVRVKLVFRGENLTLLLALIMCMYHWNFTHEINYKSLRIETKSQEKNVKNIVVSSYHT